MIGEGIPLEAVTYNLAVLAIAVIYYAWRDRYVNRVKEPAPELNQRVAYMLWVAANRTS